MENVSYSQLNELLEEFYILRSGTCVEKTVVEDEEVTYEVYKAPFGDDLYIKLKLRTDSYGENEYVSGLQFVKQVTKNVTGFESI